MPSQLKGIRRKTFPSNRTIGDVNGSGMSALSVENVVKGMIFSDLDRGYVPYIDDDAFSASRLQYDTTNAYLEFAGDPTDTKIALMVGATTSGYDKTAIYGRSYSQYGVAGESVTQAGVYGVATGSGGVGGNFQNIHSAAISNALFAAVDGASSTGATAFFRSGGAGDTLFLQANGSGRVLGISVTAASNSATALDVVVAGVGKSGAFAVTNSGSSATVLYATTNGSGIAVHGYQTGTGRAMQAQISNASSAASTMYVTTNGSGRGVDIAVSGSGSASALFATSSRTGGWVAEINATSTANGLIVSCSSTGTAITGYALGTARAGYMYRNTASPTQELVLVQEDNATGSQDAIKVVQNSDGVGVRVTSAGIGDSMVLQPATGRGLYITRNSVPVSATPVLRVFQDNGGDSSNAIEGETDGNGAALYGKNNASGYALQAVTHRSAQTSINSHSRFISNRSSAGGTGAGFGMRVGFGLETTTTQDTDAAAMTVEWVTATHASRAARVKLLVNDSGAEREAIRFEGNGTAVKIGLFGVAAVARATAITAPGAAPATYNATWGGQVVTAITDLINAIKNIGITS